MQRLSYLTETVLSHKIIRNRIVLSIRKPLGRRTSQVSSSSSSLAVTANFWSHSFSWDLCRRIHILHLSFLPSFLPFIVGSLFKYSDYWILWLSETVTYCLLWLFWLAWPKMTIYYLKLIRYCDYGLLWTFCPSPITFATSDKHCTVIVTLLGPEKIVTIAKCHNNPRCLYTELRWCQNAKKGWIWPKLV